MKAISFSFVETCDGFKKYNRCFGRTKYHMNTDQVVPFSVGAYQVDISRSQITHGDQVMSLEPKVLQVLMILARNQGQVVSHDTLMQNVWPGVVVSAGALQRCIAQLRKVFADDARRQAAIATQPKVGYSLLLPVQWHNPDHHPPTTYARFYYLAGLMLLLLLLFWVVQRSGSNITNDWHFKQLRPLTATDHREFFPSFSPDGRYIAFQRYVSDCERELWAKNLSNNQAYLLTAEPGFYGPPVWSADGQNLAFTNVSACGGPPGCRDIRGVSFALAKTKPQQPHQYMACQEESFGSISWIGNNQLAFVAKQAQQAEVRQLDLANGKQRVLYQTDEAKPYHLAYSEAQQRLLVMQHDDLRQSEMVQLDLAGEQPPLQTKLQVPGAHQNYIWWRPVWHPQENRLLAGAGHSLFAVEPNGQMHAHPLALLHGISHPVYHPDGRRIAATLGVMDLDIGQYRWMDDRPVSVSDEVIERSTQKDFAAQYRPGNDDMAWISAQTAVAQVWYRSGDQVQQLTHLPEAKPVSSFRWSVDGAMILMAAGGQLHVLDLDGEYQTINTHFRVLNVYQSIDQHRYLLSIAQDGGRFLIVFDLHKQQQQLLYTGYTASAQLGENGSAWVIDGSKEVRLLKDNQLEPVLALQGIKTAGQLHFNAGQLWLFSNQHELLMYDPLSQNRQTLVTGLQQAHAISDIRPEAGQFLYTYQANHREEVVLFEPE